MYKKLLLTVFALFFIIVGCSKQDKSTDVYKKIISRDKLIVGVKYDAKPFGFVDEDGKLEGFDVDIAHELAKRILGDSNKVEFIQVTPSTRIQAVTSGQVDFVVATMSITPQRQQIIDFSTPYYIAGQAILIPASSKIKSFSDLNNKNVIVILGTTGEKNIRYYAPSAVLQGYVNYSEAFSALKAGSASALTTDDALLIGFIMDNRNYKLLPKRMTKEPYGIAFKKSEDTIPLKNNLNRILENMQYDGTISQLKKKWNLD